MAKKEKEEKKSPKPKIYKDSLKDTLSKTESSSTKKKQEKYQSLTDVEQILHRPDMYMGSIRNSDVSLYLFDEQQNKMVC